MDFVGRKKYGCKYPGCNNWYYANVPKGFNKHFFTFPKDPYYHQLWKNICGIDVSVNAKCSNICEDHFERSAFVNERKERLNLGAIPVHALPENEDFTLLEALPLYEGNKENQTNNNTGESLDDCSSSQPPDSVDCSSYFSLASENNREVGINSNWTDSVHQDHNYYMRNEALDNWNNFSFLNNNGDEILFKTEEQRLTNEIVYKAHYNIKSRLSKLYDVLKNEEEKLKILVNLYKAGKFQFIEENLNFVSSYFLTSLLQNSCNKSSAFGQTKQDKAFAKILYKSNPQLYKCLLAYFQLPPLIFFKIPFQIGVNVDILERLRAQVEKMKPADRYCTLLFGERYCARGFRCERFKQYISGFDKAGLLAQANNALIFMVRGVKKRFHQVIACYFSSNPVSIDNLKFLIKEIISQLQEVGLHVGATVCEQNTTNCAALTQLCLERSSRRNVYYFFVNNRSIVTIFNVPQLLINTRDALLKCEIHYAPQRHATFAYIKTAFELDQQKVFRSLPKLKEEYFDFTNVDVKTSVKIAALQLSSSVASTIETFAIFARMLPSEATFTAEFLQKMDDLFDSLNSSSDKNSDYKRFRCALTKNSPHFDFWKSFMSEIGKWKLIDLNTGADVTNLYSFITGWQITINSIIFLWDSLKSINGFSYLSLRELNLEPLESVFSNVQHHVAGNTLIS